MKKRLAMALALTALVTVTVSAEELAVGAKAPAFSLVNAVDGKNVSFVPNDGKTKVVIFTCIQCPYAKAFEDRLSALGRDYAKKGVAFYAVNPNDEAKFAEESVSSMKARAADKGYPFPYLKDADSSVARSYGARVTPHVFVVDGTGAVAYRGYIDDSAKPEEREHTGMSEALDALIARQAVKVSATKAFGCSIKWKKT